MGLYLVLVVLKLEQTFHCSASEAFVCKTSNRALVACTFVKVVQRCPSIVRFGIVCTFLSALYVILRLKNFVGSTWLLFIRL